MTRTLRTKPWMIAFETPGRRRRLVICLQCPTGRGVDRHGNFYYAGINLGKKPHQVAKWLKLHRRCGFAGVG